MLAEGYEKILNMTLSKLPILSFLGNLTPDEKSTHTSAGGSILILAMVIA